MKYRWRIAFFLAGVSLLLAMVILLSPLQLNCMVAKYVTKSDILLLDPGHGGIDGGAESASGVNEKNINLAIALAIRDLAEADGWTVVLTRDEDVGLYPERDRESIRSLKTADLLARKEIIRNVMPLVAVSIHLNSFKQDSSVHGAQTFYPSGAVEETVFTESKSLAEIIQANLIAGLADGTEREALGKRDSLILKKSPVPIVIVECGFLSNPGEAAKLMETSYQAKLARSIYQGIMEYAEKEPAHPMQIIDTRAKDGNMKTCV